MPTTTWLSEAGEKIVKHFLALLGRKWDQILDESNDQRDPENFVTHDTENGDWRIVIDSTNLPEFRDGMLASLIAPLAAFHGWTIFGLDDKGEVVDDHHLGELISEEEEAREGYGKTLRWLEDHNLATCHGLMRLTESTLRDNYECPEELIPSVRKIANAIGMKLR